MNSNEKPENQRGDQRKRVFLKGTILRGVRHSETVCLLRDVSETGARLKVGIDQPVPEEFLLALPHEGKAYRCRLAWRNGPDAGVVFMGSEPIPRWHYG